MVHWTICFLENEKNRGKKVIRFCFEEKRTRIAHLGDLVFNNKGKNIGFVTSCAIDKEGFLTGQACIEAKYAITDTPIFIFQKTDSQKSIDFSKLKEGDKISLPSKAKIIKRFPRL